LWSICSSAHRGASAPLRFRLRSQRDLRAESQSVSFQDRNTIGRRVGRPPARPPASFDSAAQRCAEAWACPETEPRSAGTAATRARLALFRKHQSLKTVFSFQFSVFRKKREKLLLKTEN